MQYVSYGRSLTGHRFNLIDFPLVARNLCMICPNRCPCLLKFALLAKATQIFDFIFANLFKICHSVLHKSRTKSLGISHSLSIYPGTYLTCQHFPQHTIDFFFLWPIIMLLSNVKRTDINHFPPHH